MSFKKYVLIEAPTKSSLKEGKDYATMVDSSNVRVINFLTWAAVDEMIPKGLVGWYPVSGEQAFKAAKKEEPVVVAFMKSKETYLFRLKSNVILTSKGNRLDFSDVQDMVDDYPEMKSLSGLVRDNKTTLFFPFINKPTEQDALNLDASSGWKDYWAAMFQYVREQDGDIGAELQTKLISDATNVTKCFGKKGNSKDAFRNGIIGKLVDWDKSVLIQQIVRLSSYDYSRYFETRLIDEFELPDIISLIKNLIAKESYDSYTCIKSVITYASNANIIKSDADLSKILQLIPEEKIDKVIGTDNLVDMFDKLTDKLKETLVRAHHKFVLKNVKLFPSKWVERARWKEKEKFDIRY